MSHSNVRLKRQHPTFLSEPPLWFRRVVNTVIFFIGTILVINAFAGDNGFIDMLTTKNTHAVLLEDLSRLRAENESLRNTAKRLQEDPRAIEEVARDKLGLIKPGELLLIFTNDHPKYLTTVEDSVSPNAKK